MSSGKSATPRGRPARAMADRRAALRLRRMAERLRAALERRLTDGDAFAKRDDPVAMLLKLTQVTERIAALEDAVAEPAARATIAAADRAVIERYVAWRLRAHGIDAGVAGVPAPLGSIASDDDAAA